MKKQVHQPKVYQIKVYFINVLQKIQKIKYKFNRKKKIKKMI